MDQQLADLHTHTTASDGVLTPTEIVKLAKEVGLSAIGITDHDTTAGIEEAIKEGETIGIRVVPGVEISTQAGGQDIHLLGYYLNWKDPMLQQRLSELRSVRDKRNELMIARLNELGLSITMEEVLDQSGRTLHPEETVGRPHMAEVLIRKGYVKTTQEAFDKYLAREGSAYVNIQRIEPEEAIQWIHDAGGIAVIAHPGLYRDDALVTRLIDEGLDGIEAFHSDHTADASKRYMALAARKGILVTAGSDYHGDRGDSMLHGHLGTQTVDISILDLMKVFQARRREEK